MLSLRGQIIPVTLIALILGGSLWVWLGGTQTDRFQLIGEGVAGLLVALVFYSNANLDRRRRNRLIHELVVFRGPNIFKPLVMHLGPIRGMSETAMTKVIQNVATQRGCDELSRALRDLERGLSPSGKRQLADVMWVVLPNYVRTLRARADVLLPYYVDHARVEVVRAFLYQLETVLTFEEWTKRLGQIPDDHVRHKELFQHATDVLSGHSGILSAIGPEQKLK